MKRFVIIILSLLSLSIYCVSQTPIKVGSIIGKKWDKHTKNNIRIIEFGKDSINISSIYSSPDDTIRYSKPYYLSDSIPTSFDFSKVGKPSEGKYLIDYNGKIQELEYCEIKVLNDNNLILFFEQKDGYIGGADMTITYTRIKPEDE